MLTAKEAKKISVHNKTLEVLLKKIDVKIQDAAERGHEFTQFTSEALDSLNVRVLVSAKLKQCGYKVYTGNINKIDIYWETAE